MGIIKKLSLMFVANGVGLYLATAFVPGVTIPLALVQFATVTFILTVINFFIRPIIKIAFMPIMILTLGLGSILINALVLYIFDFLVPSVTIHGLVALAITTLIVSSINLVIRFSAKII